MEAMPVEPVEFCSDGIRLAGHLYRPAVPTGPAGGPAVVLCGGLGAIKEMIVPAIARHLSDRGYTALAFDYRGFGESDGARNRLIPAEQARDVRQAVTFLRTVDGVDGDHIVLYANSFGVGPAIVAAAVDRRVCGLVAVVGVARGYAWLRSLRSGWEWRRLLADVEADRIDRVLGKEGRWVEPNEVMPADPASAEWGRAILQQFPQRAYRLPLETVAEILEWSPIDLVPALGTRPALFVLAENDVLVPPEQTVEMYERATGPRELFRLTDAEHHDATGGPKLAEVLDRVDRWLAAHVPAGTAAVSDIKGGRA
jgi:pimeloyl-ACP methyl ester carboxylesterase